MTDLAPLLAERVIDRRASLMERAIVRMLCRFAVDIARESYGPDVTLDEAEDVLDDALRCVKPKDQR